MFHRSCHLAANMGYATAITWQEKSCRRIAAERVSFAFKQLPLQGRHGRCHFIVSGTNIESSLMESLRDEETVRIVFRQAAPGRQDSPASMPGAEALSGEGDFLFCKGKRTKRIQGPMVASKECRKIADYLRTHNLTHCHIIAVESALFVTGNQ